MLLLQTHICELQKHSKERRWKSSEAKFSTGLEVWSSNWKFQFDPFNEEKLRNVKDKEQFAWKLDRQVKPPWRQQLNYIHIVNFTSFQV